MAGGTGAGGLGGGKAPRLTPLDNWAFQKIFGEDGGKGASMTLANLVLERVGLEPLERIDHVQADASRPNTVGLKAPRTDVLLVSGERMVDMEAELTGADVEGKSLYYAATLLAGRVRKGADVLYRSLPQTVVIVFLQGRKMFPSSERFVTPARIHWETGGGEVGGDCVRGGDRFAFVVCELDKVAERYNGASEEVVSDELTAWLYVLARGYSDEREMGDIMGKVLSVEEFGERYGLAMGDPEAWDAYVRHVKWEMSMNDTIAAATESGYGSGYGEALKSVAEALRESGVPEDLIGSAVRRAEEACILPS